MNKSYRFVLICLGLAFAFSCAKEPDLPGSLDGGIRLPNHWVLTPAGNHIPVGDLPLNMTLSPDGSLLAVTNNGYTRQFISLIDTATDTVKAELTINKGFYGLAFSNDGQYLYSSGGADDCVLVWHNEGWSLYGKTIHNGETYYRKSKKHSRLD